MKLIDDTIYIATSGGLLITTDPGDLPEMYNNLNGLGTIDISDVIKDADGQLWVAGFGRLIKFDGMNSSQYPFIDNDGDRFRVYALADDGENIWVGTQLGLILFSKTADGGQIEDSYTQFGNLNPQPAVFDITIDGDSIWLATSAGLAVGLKTDPVALKAPAAWTVFGPDDFPILGTGSMSRMALFESKVYLATARSAFRMDRLPLDTVFTELTIGRDSAFTDLKVENDTLFMYYAGGVAVVKDTVASYLPLAGLPTKGLSTGLNTGSYRWVDLAVGGIYTNDGGGFASYVYGGAPGNDVTDIAVNRSGVMVAALARDQIGRFTGSEWEHIVQPFGGDMTISALADSNSAFWVGTFGNGMWRIVDDSLKNFDENNSTLRGNTDGIRGRSYVVVKGIVTDGQYLFVGCYRALNGHPIAVGRMNELDIPASWDSIGIPHGATDTFITTLDCAPGSVVYGTEANGIFWCRNGGSGDWNTDDSVDCVRMTKDSRFLRSDVIRVVKFAPDGSLYVGTNFGISWYDFGIDFFVDFDLPSGISSDITDIEFDGRGNMWVTTKSGAARRDAVTGEFTIYTAENSGLVSNDIRCVTADKFNGEVYFGTSSGISVLLPGIGQPTSSLDSVFAFPNPYVIDADDDRVSFNFLRPYSVNIYDASGALVREKINTDSWDGRNEAGERVASGVYIFVLTDQTGIATRGKILLINNQ